MKSVYNIGGRSGLRLITNRAIFIDYFPPHVEDIIPEYVKRLLLVRGSIMELKKIKGSTVIQRMRAFYRQLTPQDFVKISQSYKIDYVIIEGEFSHNFAKIRPVFRDKTMTVYDVRDLQEETMKKNNIEQHSSRNVSRYLQLALEGDIN
jgi:hypothetical protein